MLSDLLISGKEAIIAGCTKRVLRFEVSGNSDMTEGWAVFYDDLINLILGDSTTEYRAEHGRLVTRATKNAREYVKLGYTISEVVLSYGIISQSISQVALEIDYALSPGELSQLSGSVDAAIAESVAEFERAQSEARDLKETERIGSLAHELRNSLQSATLAFQMIESGSFGIQSNTSVVLQNSLQRMGSLIDKALTEVRMRVEPHAKLERVRLSDVLSEVGIMAGFQARARGLSLRTSGPADVEVIADRQLLVSAIANLVQNAIKFTPAHGVIDIRSRRSLADGNRAEAEVGGKVLIEIHDQCGGLPANTLANLFQPFVQSSEDKTGVGLGLAIAKASIERSKGRLRVEDHPGFGCTFIVELPEAIDTDTPQTQY